MSKVLGVLSVLVLIFTFGCKSKAEIKNAVPADSAKVTVAPATAPIVAGDTLKTPKTEKK